MQDLNPPDTNDLPRASEITFPADAKSIARLVADATIVGLGCNTRESHDLFRLVEDVTHHLIEAGFRVVAIYEEPRVCEMFDRYILGEDVDLNAAMSQAWGLFQTVEMKHALLRLRERNSRNPLDPVHIIGIDQPHAIVADYDEAVDQLSRIDPNVAVRVEEKLNSIKIAHGSGEHVFHAHGAHSGIPFIETAQEARAVVASIPESDGRDKALQLLNAIVDHHRNGVAPKKAQETAAATLLAFQRRTGNRVVLWDAFYVLAAHEGEALGFHLRQALGDQYKVVLVLFGSGRILGGTVPQARADSLEAYLASAGGARMLDLRSPDAPAEVVERPWPIRAVSGIYHPDHDHQHYYKIPALRASFDVLVFLPETDAVRPLPTGNLHGLGSLRQNASKIVPYTLVNTFTAIEGGIDALTAFQLSEMRDMGAEAASHGWLGNEVYRSEDGASLIVVTRFKSVESREKWAETERSRRHVRELMPLVKDITSVPVTFLAAHGDSPIAGGSQ